MTHPPRVCLGRVSLEIKLIDKYLKQSVETVNCFSHSEVQLRSSMAKCKNDFALFHFLWFVDDKARLKKVLIVTSC